MKISEIKPGMTLRRKSHSHGGMRPGDTGIVKSIRIDVVVFEGEGSWAEHDPINLELVEDPKPEVLPIFN